MTKDEVLTELSKRGIHINIGGCGCCGSPWVTIAIDGKTELSEDNCDVNNFPQELQNDS